MPESVKDRCTKSHEYIFLLSKSAKYFYDADAVREKALNDKIRKRSSNFKKVGLQDDKFGSHNKGAEIIDTQGFRNKRDVWTVTTKPYSAAHFATFPPELPETCIKAGCLEGGTVLDPFHGAGTTGMVAARLHRKYIGIELNPEYVELSKNRIYNDAPLFNQDIFVPVSSAS